jgi:hypothetical protein
MTSDVDFLANAYGECDRERRMREIRTSGVTRGVGASTTAVLAPPLLYCPSVRQDKPGQSRKLKGVYHVSCSYDM